MCGAGGWRMKVLLDDEIIFMHYFLMSNINFLIHIMARRPYGPAQSPTNAEASS
jgi:hypothetical protein